MNKNLALLLIVILSFIALFGIFSLTQSFSIRGCLGLIVLIFYIAILILGLSKFDKEEKSAKAENYNYYTIRSRTDLLAKDAIKNLWLSNNGVSIKLDWTIITISDNKRTMKITADRNTIVNLWLSLCPVFDGEAVTYESILQMVNKSGIKNLSGVKIKETDCGVKDTVIKEIPNQSEKKYNRERNIEL